jgi:hypothetical protein
LAWSEVKRFNDSALAFAVAAGGVGGGVNKEHLPLRLRFS